MANKRLHLLILHFSLIETDTHGFCSFLFYFILFYFFCADNHLNNVTAVEEGDTLSVTASDISSTNRSLILISVAVKLPNEKVILLKGAKI